MLLHTCLPTHACVAFTATAAARPGMYGAVAYGVGFAPTPMSVLPVAVDANHAWISRSKGSAGG